ncbi:hypothetical protein [cyanobacterium endosymbiont of Epithemia clementina EcSB]|uniref:hypothetical protein n=1 Tax=cyanobacterium endosymbiont of Epithemia clementina EcSB TaxID=3034674 RepID=UPI002480964F|nr:hypothetical protein [cyanobacterium endosymbiont of Epithemia clementina EcSB]WGT68386.1 hypothetical protein P3F56_04925 [cyanobacterium endosymbiont of Epithemia clementina EcSB]
MIAGALKSPITSLTLARFQKIGALTKTGCYSFYLCWKGPIFRETGAQLLSSVGLKTLESDSNFVRWWLKRLH